jgi:predicted transcriptional regulator
MNWVTCMSLEKQNLRVLVTNDEGVVITHCKEYSKAVYIVPAKEREDYSAIVERHKHLFSVCNNLEIEIFRLELGLPEKPLRSILSTLLKYYNEFDEIRVVVGDRAASTTLLVLATLLLPQDKQVKLTAVSDFEVHVDVNKFTEYLKLDDVSKLVYDHMLVFGPTKLGEIAEYLNKPVSTMHRKLKSLVEKGLARESETAVFRAEQFIYVYPY